MKTVKLCEFKDLSKEVQSEVWEREIQQRIEIELELLAFDLTENTITEDEYYASLGCTKYYAETTGWFIPACYYEKNRKCVNEMVKEDLERRLFTCSGSFVQTF